LIPIGYTDNGGTMCWRAKNGPDVWSIVCLDGKFTGGYDFFETCVTGFLAGFLQRRLVPKTFPRDVFPLGKPAFRPYTTQ
jgi:hypothetical protein